MKTYLVLTDKEREVIRDSLRNSMVAGSRVLLKKVLASELFDSRVGDLEIIGPDEEELKTESP